MSPNTSPVLIIAWLAAAVVVLVVGGGFIMGIAMGGMMDGMGGMMGRGSSARQTPVVATGAEVTVDIRDFDYLPRDLNVEAGTTITWTNFDSAPHTATDKDDTWDTGRLDKNQSAPLTFDNPGQYDYYCTYHPYMEATLTVR